MKKVKPARRKKDSNVYPPGWDARRTAAVATYHDARQDQSILGEDVDSGTRTGLVWMEIPQELVPQVRKLIARQRTPA